jgi:hypothetical protein
VLSSSNSGSLVNFSAGTKDVFVDYPAGRAVYENEAGNVDGYPITGGTINNTVIGGTTPAAGTFTTLIGGGGSANYFQTQGSATTKAVEVKALGSDTNIAFVIDSKGTGAIDLAAGSSGVNISNGGTVTAITRTAGGSFYTSVPAIAISAPTTAGGVQATASINITLNNVVISSGGTGYTVGDVLTVVGGTGTAVVLTVGTVSAGVITAVTISNFGAYSVAPSNPMTVTGGTGTGATFTPNFGVQQGITITNAGSGYVEQPTISFSGGGGSSAAAYATVGSIARLTSIGSGLEVAAASGIGFRVANSGTANVNYYSAQGNSSGGSVLLAATGTDTDISSAVSSKGAGSVRFQTNNAAQEQMRVSHTASAVNYVQVTGAATTARPAITAQGSDTNIGLNVQTKGTGSFFFVTGGSSIAQLVVTNTASSVNYINVTGGATGVAPVVSALGNDTNIPLVLQPKGTGALQAQQTDSTATGGNARGANAVDWQTVRNSASQVANTATSVISGGRNNTATYDSFSGGGFNNNNAGQASVIAGGYSNTTAGTFSFIGGGQSNTTNGFYNIVVGGWTNSGTANAAVTTQSGTMNGTTAVTLSGSNANIKVGQFIQGTSIAGQTYVAAISGTSLTLSQAASGSSTSTLSFYTPHGVVVGGGNNQATGSYSFIGGGGDAGTAANRNVASGDWSVVCGGIQNTATNTYASVLGGANVSATGAYAVSLGGAGNSSSGFGSTNLGGNGNVANGTYAIAGGYSSTNRSIATFAFAAGNASRNGDAQTEIFVLRNITTDATPAVLTTNAAAAGTTTQVILPNNSAYYFRGTVVAGVTGGGNTKGWTVEGVIKRGANAASTALVGTATVTSSYADAGASTWALTATADTTNGGLAITFTGQAATTIRTVCSITTTEMTF